MVFNGSQLCLLIGTDPFSFLHFKSLTYSDFKTLKLIVVIQGRNLYK